MSDTHEVFAIRYGHHDRPAHENYIGGDPHDILQPLNYFVWVIRGAHGTFVMDTGFDHAMAAKRGRLIIKPVADGLRAIDVNPDEVRDVIISHMHYDHCGNHDLFPRARYHLQDREMMYSTGRFMCHAHQRIPFETDDVVAMVRKVFEDRVVFHDGHDTLVPGVTLHHIGGHSMGLQCARVKTARGHVVLAADATLEAPPYEGVRKQVRCGELYESDDIVAYLNGQQLPTVESVDAFSASAQTGIAQLAIAYCSVMVDSDPLRTAFFGQNISPNGGSPARF